MKPHLFIVLLFLSFNSFAQPKFVKATSQGWAGGVCCRTGSDYTITISGSRKELEAIKIKLVCIGGMKFESPKSTFISSLTKTKCGLIISCSYSYDSAEENINLIDKKPAPCNENCVIYKGKKKEIKIKITEVTALEFIAYP